MADTTAEVVHQHYANSTAAIAAMNAKNWAFEEAGDRLIIMDGATPRYFDTTVNLLASNNWILNQTASSQSGGFNVSGAGLVGGALTVGGAADFATTVSVTGILTAAASVVVGSGLTVGTNLTVTGLSTGRIPVVSTAGLITQDNLYWDATNDRIGVGSAASSPSAVGSFYGGTGASAGIILGTNLTNATNKEGRLKASHYTNAEEPVTMAWLSSTSSASTLNIGGNSSSENAATAIDFYTAANNTTVTGTRRGGFNSSGAFDVVGALSSGALTATTANFSSTITTPLTASLPVFTNGSSQLTTNAMTGTGNVVMSASPTLTGTLTAAAITASGLVTASASLTMTGVGTFNLTDNTSNAFRVVQGSDNYVQIYTTNGAELAAFGSQISTCSTSLIGGSSVELSSSGDIYASGYFKFNQSIRLDGYISAGALSTSAGSPTTITSTGHNSYTFSTNNGAAGYCTISGPDSGRMMFVRNRSSQQLYITNGGNAVNALANGANAILIGNGSTWDAYSSAS